MSDVLPQQSTSLPVPCPRIAAGSDVMFDHFCLLDNLVLDDGHSLQLGDYSVRYFESDELRAHFYGRDDHLSDREFAKLAEMSQFPWATISLPPTHFPIDVRDHKSGQPTSRADIERMLFHTNHALSHHTEPFTGLLRVLALLKPATGPIIPRAFCMRPPVEIQTGQQIAWRRFSSLWTENEPAPDGPARPVLVECELSNEDVEAFSALELQLRKCLANDSRPGYTGSSHLENAVHFFERGDRFMVPDAMESASVDALLAFDAAVEALLIRETENSVERKLRTRIGAVFLKHPQREHVVNLARKIFWIRSKAVHGVRSVSALEGLIKRNGDAEIGDARGGPIPAGPYSTVLVNGTCSHFPALLSNARELARRVIRHFCDAFDRGIDREVTLRKLNADQGP